MMVATLHKEAGMLNENVSASILAIGKAVADPVMGKALDVSLGLVLGQIFSLPPVLNRGTASIQSFAKNHDDG